MESSYFTLDGPKGRNDDRYLLPEAIESGFVAAVADGVGGSTGGGTAAEIAIAACHEWARLSPTPNFQVVLESACHEMAQAALRDSNLKSMATTLSFLRTKNDTAEVIHIGDSRIYHLRGSGLATRTQDQTEVAELLRQGVLTPSQAKRYPRRNVLKSYLSGSGEFSLHRESFKIKDGDFILLLTDGVYKSLTKAEIVGLRANFVDPDDFAVAARNLIIENGIGDDSTMIVIKI